MRKTALVAFGLSIALAVQEMPRAWSQEDAQAQPKKAAAKEDSPAGKPAPPLALKPEDEAVAREAFALLQTKCSKCHKNSEVSEFEWDRAGVLQRISNVKSPRTSKLFSMLYTEVMPPPANDKLNVRELRLVEKWISLGAPFFDDEKPRPQITELDLCHAIERDLVALEMRGARAEDMRHQRYLTLVNLHNNQRGVTSDELRIYRAAISKLLNSMTRRKSGEIFVPTAVDPEQQTIFRFDLRSFGWTPADWVEVLKRYPYGIEYNDDRVRESHERIKARFTRTASNPIPYVRADWFVARASLPELYYHLLGSPSTDAELEKQLGVTVEANLTNGQDVARAGFSESGVSVNNRMVERHVLSVGAYWKSYDFKESSGEKNLFLRPLGPKLAGLKSFEEFAFKHDGGEMIYNLPNGMQAYFLTDDKGKRINAGPVEVVRDRLESAGNPVVVNGLSCIACHQRGMHRFKDAVREGFQGIAAAEKDKVKELYPPAEAMNGLLDEDEARYKNAVFRATRGFLGLKTADDVYKFPEPVSQLAQRVSGRPDAGGRGPGAGHGPRRPERPAHGQPEAAHRHAAAGPQHQARVLGVETAR